MKFSAQTITHYPIAHMVWYAGADDASTGLIFGWGALDFAGGTVVHINAGVAALVGCLIIGKRTGYQKEIMAPHSLTMTLIGTGLLWCGWFGRSEEHTSELQSLMRISYAVFCLKKKNEMRNHVI